MELIMQEFIEWINDRFMSDDLITGAMIEKKAEELLKKEEKQQQYQMRWIPVSEMRSTPLNDDTILLFDNGQTRRFNEEHPFAEITHFLNLPPKED